MQISFSDQETLLVVREFLPLKFCFSVLKLIPNNHVAQLFNFLQSNYYLDPVFHYLVYRKMLCWKNKISYIFWEKQHLDQKLCKSTDQCSKCILPYPLWSTKVIIKDLLKYCLVTQSVRPQNVVFQWKLIPSSNRI